MREIEEVTTARIPTVEEVSESLKNFTTIDYTIFIGMLLVCTFVGLYFGYQDQKIRKRYKKQAVGYSEAANYLMGGRNMPVIPIALSLIASFVSGTVLLG
jgi:Na+/proline symporter